MPVSHFCMNTAYNFLHTYAKILSYILNNKRQAYVKLWKGQSAMVILNCIYLFLIVYKRWRKKSPWIISSTTCNGQFSWFAADKARMGGKKKERNWKLLCLIVCVIYSGWNWNFRKVGSVGHFFFFFVGRQLCWKDHLVFIVTLSVKMDVWMYVYKM